MMEDIKSGRGRVARDVKVERFTSGPWIAFKGAGWCVSRPNAKMAHMVGMHASFSLVGAESDDEKEAEANAHLIAAAPDLYKALSDLVSTVALECADPDAFIIRQEIKAARAALAKARGEL